MPVNTDVFSCVLNIAAGAKFLQRKVKRSLASRLSTVLVQLCSPAAEVMPQNVCCCSKESVEKASKSRFDSSKVL